MHVYNTSSLNHVRIDGPAGINRNLNFSTSGSTRWNIYANSTAESGSDSGSNLTIAKYTDAGVYNGVAMFIERSSGSVGIGTSDPYAGLHVNKFYSWSSLSDSQKEKSISGDISAWFESGNDLTSERAVYRFGSDSYTTAGSEYVTLQMMPNNGDRSKNLGHYIESYKSQQPNSDTTNHLAFGSVVRGASLGAAATQSEAMRIDSSGRVGIGTGSPSSALHVQGSTNTATFESTTSSAFVTVANSGGSASISTSGNDLFLITPSGSGGDISFRPNSSEAMRIGSSGVLSVANTTTAYGLRVTSSLTGMSYTPTDYLTVAADNGPCFYGNRTGSNGDIMVFNKDGSTVGSIGTAGGSSYIAGIAATGGIGFASSGGQPFINPVTNTGANNDNAINLGHPTSRFENLYLSGDVFVNKTTKTAAGSGIVLDGDGFAYFVRDGAVQILLGNDDTGGTSQEAIRFVRASSDVGSIDTTSTSTAYNTSSDYRLKTDAQPMTGASARVQALNPVNFEWIANGTRVDGFLAHEAQEVVPEAVTGTKDAMRDEEYEVTPAVLNDEGSVVTEAVMGTRSVPDYQGIDQSKLVPLLTAALQEALTKIDALETRITALEG